MATDATGAPTPLGIPKYNVSVDAPSGLGFNAAMDSIDSIITAKQLPTASGTNKVPVWNGSSWVAQTVPPAGITPGTIGQSLGTNSGGSVAWLGGMHKLFDTTLAANGNFDFPTIPSGYVSLVLHFNVYEQSGVGTVAMRFNGDAGASYSTVTLTANNNAPSVTSTNGYANTSARIGRVVSTATTYTFGEVIIPFYSNLQRKQWLARSFNHDVDNTAGLYADTNTGTWNNTDGIFRIQVISTATNFIPNSRVVVYGLGA